MSIENDDSQKRSRLEALWLRVEDRILDALEFSGRAVMRTQHSDPPGRYVSPRSAR